MCDNWREDMSKQYTCEGIVLDSGKGEYVVKGSIQSLSPNATVLFWAPNPPTYTTSYSGSGLPYPNPEMAFENTPNKGAVKLNGGTFEFRVQYPNSYYIGLGSLYIPPCVFIKVCEQNGDGNVKTIQLGNGIPFRMLTYPPSYDSVPRTNPHFYSGRDNLAHRTQAQILKDSAFPSKNEMPSNFWGNAVPHE
jgi:hypothetical protein